MWQYDFTTRDFDELARNHILYGLNHLRTTDPAKFQSDMQTLRNGQAVEIYYKLYNPFVEQEILGGNLTFETRVPIVVPPTAYLQK